MASASHKNALFIPAWWLVIFTYIAFGWYWHSLLENLERMPFFRQFPILFWPFIIIVNLIIISLCTVPRSFINSRVLSWFDSSLFFFIFMVFASVFTVLILTHINALATLLVLGTVIAIARLDLQIRAYSTRQSWLSLLLAAVIGCSLGITAHTWHQSDVVMPERSQTRSQPIESSAQFAHPSKEPLILSQSRLN